MTQLSPSLWSWSVLTGESWKKSPVVWCRTMARLNITRNTLADIYLSWYLSVVGVMWKLSGEGLCSVYIVEKVPSCRKPYQLEFFDRGFTNFLNILWFSEFLNLCNCWSKNNFHQEKFLTKKIFVQRNFLFKKKVWANIFW